MKYWPPDRPTMQGTRFPRVPSVSAGWPGRTTQKSIPRISRDQRQMAAVGCIYLRSATSLGPKLGEHHPRSYLFSRSDAEGVVAEGVGFETHGDAAATIVFKTNSIVSMRFHGIPSRSSLRRSAGYIVLNSSASATRVPRRVSPSCPRTASPLGPGEDHADPGPHGATPAAVGEYHGPAPRGSAARTAARTTRHPATPGQHVGEG
jgi:hypothetical protein